jgi:hypothetical protein
MHIRSLMKLLLLTMLSSNVSNTTAMAKSINIATKPVTTHKVSIEKQQHKVIKRFITKKCFRNCVDADKLQNALNLASAKYEVSPELILSVMATESSFHQDAVSGVCGYGLMQVCLPVHNDKFKKLKVVNHFNIYPNILVGTQILKDCMNRHSNNTTKSLQCYNGSTKTIKYASKVKLALVELRDIQKDVEKEVS